MTFVFNNPITKTLVAIFFSENISFFKEQF